MFAPHFISKAFLTRFLECGSTCKRVTRLAAVMAISVGVAARASEATRPVPLPPFPPNGVDNSQAGNLRSSGTIRPTPGSTGGDRPYQTNQNDNAERSGQAKARTSPLRPKPTEQIGVGNNVGAERDFKWSGPPSDDESSSPSFDIADDGLVYTGEGVNRRLIGKAGLIHTGRGSQREAYWSYDDFTRRAPSTLDSLQFGYKQRKLDEVQKPTTMSRFLPGNQSHANSATEWDGPQIKPDSVRKVPPKKVRSKPTGKKLTLIPAETFTTGAPDLEGGLPNGEGMTPENAIAAYSAIIDNSAQPLELRQEARKRRAAAYLARGTKSDINNALIDQKAAGLPGIQLTIRAESAEMKVVTEVTGWVWQNQSVLVTNIQGDWLWVAAIDGNDSVKGYITMNTVVAQPPQQATFMTSQQQWYPQYEYQEYDYEPYESGPKSIWETPEWETPAQIREGRRNGTLR